MQQQQQCSSNLHYSSNYCSNSYSTVVTYAWSKQSGLHVEARRSMFQSNHQLVTKERQLTTSTTHSIHCVKLNIIRSATDNYKFTVWLNAI